MKKNEIILLVTVVGLLFAFGSFADNLTFPTTYSSSGQVTSQNLNNNFSAVSAIVNGHLDNDNADTTSGYRFYQVLSSFPSVASQGMLVYVTSDLSLYVYNGSSWDRIGP